MSEIDISTNSPLYFYWKSIGTLNENLNFDIRVLRLKGYIFLSIVGTLPRFETEARNNSEMAYLQSHAQGPQDLRLSWEHPRVNLIRLLHV